MPRNPRNPRMVTRQIALTRREVQILRQIAANLELKKRIATTTVIKALVRWLGRSMSNERQRRA